MGAIDILPQFFLEKGETTISHISVWGHKQILLCLHEIVFPRFVRGFMLFPVGKIPSPPGLCVMHTHLCGVQVQVWGSALTERESKSDTKKVAKEDPKGDRKRGSERKSERDAAKQKAGRSRSSQASATFLGMTMA